MKTKSFLIRICKFVVVVAGVIYLAKWAFNRFVSEKAKGNDSLEMDSEIEISPEKNSMLDVDIEAIKNECSKEIVLRHQEAAKMMKEMMNEIADSPKDKKEEVETGEKLNFDDIDASLDKLFDGE